VDHDLYRDSVDAPDLAHLGGAHRPWQDDSVSTNVAEERDIGNRLGAAADARSQPEFRKSIPQRRQNPDVIHDEVSNPQIEQSRDTLEELRTLLRFRDGIDRHVELPSGRGDLSLRGHQLVPIQFAPRPASTPTLEAHIYRVCARVERGTDGLRTSGGRQKEYFVLSTIHCVE
jgi:hypothetical protein